MIEETREGAFQSNLKLSRRQNWCHDYPFSETAQYFRRFRNLPKRLVVGPCILILTNADVGNFSLTLIFLLRKWLTSWYG